MQRVKLAASILVFLAVVTVFGYLFYQPIYGEQKRRTVILMAVREAVLAAPDTQERQYEPKVRMFNLLSDAADLVIEFRDRQTGESKFFRYAVSYREGRWVVTQREPFVPAMRK
jgi:hypothetical protein